MAKSEIRVEVPYDCKLVGVTTDGDVAIITYEPIIITRKIGFLTDVKKKRKTR